MTFDAEQVLKSLPSETACVVSYGDARLVSPTRKLTQSGEWVTEIYGVASSYTFSVWITAAEGKLHDIKAGRRITVDGENYAVMNIDKKAMDSLWRIDVETIHD